VSLPVRKPIFFPHPMTETSEMVALPLFLAQNWPPLFCYAKAVHIFSFFSFCRLGIELPLSFLFPLSHPGLILSFFLLSKNRASPPPPPPFFLSFGRQYVPPRLFFPPPFPPHSEVTQATFFSFSFLIHRYSFSRGREFFFSLPSGVIIPLPSLPLFFFPACEVEELIPSPPWSGRTTLVSFPLFPCDHKLGLPSLFFSGQRRKPSFLGWAGLRGLFP